jgi:hypothetical protein
MDTRIERITNLGACLRHFVDCTGRDNRGVIVTAPERHRYSILDQNPNSA